MQKSRGDGGDTPHSRPGGEKAERAGPSRKAKIVEISLPRNPTEQEHPIIGLKVSSIYSEALLRDFSAQCPGSILLSFADGSAVNIANECGLTEEVDTLIGSVKNIMTSSYQGTLFQADAPGFDEFVIRADNSEGKALQSFEKFQSAWNEERDRILPLTDRRVRLAETLALFREEMNLLQKQFRGNCVSRGTTFSIAGYCGWLAKHLGKEVELAPTPQARILQAGELALRLSQQRRQSEVEEIASGELPSERRRVLSLVPGHVEIHESDRENGVLTPLVARQASDYAEKLSSAFKKGETNSPQLQPLSTFVDRRGDTADEVKQMVTLADRFELLKHSIYEPGQSTESMVQTAHQMLRIVSSDRELGEGIVRFEQAKDEKLEVFFGRKLLDGERFSVIEIDLVAGGALNKEFGFAAFGRMIQEYLKCIRSETNAQLVARKGGGLMIVMSEPNFGPRRVSELARKLDHVSSTLLHPNLQSAHEVQLHRERIELAQVNYGARLALYGLLSNIQRIDPNADQAIIPDAFTQRIKQRDYVYRNGDTIAVLSGER